MIIFYFLGFFITMYFYFRFCTCITAWTFFTDTISVLCISVQSYYICF